MLNRAIRKALVHTRTERDLILVRQDILRSDLLMKLDIGSNTIGFIRGLSNTDKRRNEIRIKPPSPKINLADPPAAEKPPTKPQTADRSNRTYGCKA